MTGNDSNIIVFNKSAIILQGLNTIIKQMGIEPILIKEPEEFLDYPQMLGYALIILPKTLWDEYSGFIEKSLSAATSIKPLFFATEESLEEEININDSALIIQHKIDDVLKELNTDVSSPAELTQRELEVLKLMAYGHINKEIADQLNISTHTVISHRKNISEKTGIKTIPGLTMYAVIKKIIDLSELNMKNLK